MPSKAGFWTRIEIEDRDSYSCINNRMIIVLLQPQENSLPFYAIMSIKLALRNIWGLKIRTLKID